MNVTRIGDALPYDAPNHRDVVAYRLQGPDQGASRSLVGFSVVQPGGGAGPDSSPFEKVYVVVRGEITVIIDGTESVLGPMDSCTIAPDEVREIVNRGTTVCEMLTVLPVVGTR
ncbi:MAG TPA: cupin domain-containing protein [Microbacterium sp.]|uniref:cupin domain-containing protein n=1 Tax=Microbacterium sp. TaxID=51671 RepID=UPI002B6D4B19|nr:cupin domain-containing protein [Microbacterium sp.]HWI31696.1 cupin domain-containing protein [Microbacterium sp.]